MQLQRYANLPEAHRYDGGVCAIIQYCYQRTVTKYGYCYSTFVTTFFFLANHNKFRHIASTTQATYQANSKMEKHILKSFSVKAKDFDFNDALQKCEAWLVSVLAAKNCYRSVDKREKKCRCFAFLIDNPNVTREAAKYMLHWAGLKPIEKKELLNTWIRYSAADENKNLILPLLQEEREEPIPDHFICRHAVFAMLNVGRKLQDSATKSPTKKHGNAGKKGADNNRGKKYIDAHASLHSFFTELKEEALPFATRLIREKTGMVTRDDDPDNVALPPHLSKRQIYAKWCWSRGHKVVLESTNRSIHVRVEDYLARPNDDDSPVPLWPTGSERKQICSWTAFLRYWDKNFPNIKMRKRGANTCTDCLRAAHELCNVGGASMAVGNQDVDGENADGDDNQQLVSTIANVEQKLAAAKLHVVQYQSQRALVNKMISLAKSNVKNNIPLDLRRKVITIDMGQNIGLPNFESEQPGDTYYFSP